jgi:hypothetical protein
MSMDIGVAPSPPAALSRFELIVRGLDALITLLALAGGLRLAYLMDWVPSQPFDPANAAAFEFPVYALLGIGVCLAPAAVLSAMAFGCLGLAGPVCLAGAGRLLGARSPDTLIHRGRPGPLA